jgi:predicted histidine transporter YuiF (NhaC family)
MHRSNEKLYCINVRSEVLIPVTMKIAVVWIVTPCSLVVFNHIRIKLWFPCYALSFSLYVHLSKGL